MSWNIWICPGKIQAHIDGLVQDCSIPIANALGILLMHWIYFILALSHRYKYVFSSGYIRNNVKTIRVSCFYCNIKPNFVGSAMSGSASMVGFFINETKPLIPINTIPYRSFIMHAYICCKYPNHVTIHFMKFCIKILDNIMSLYILWSFA